MKEQNPVEEEKAPPAINVKQMVTVGAIMAATGTVVGAVVMEFYRYMRPKIPIPPPPALGAPQQNPTLPWAHPSPFNPAGFPSPPRYAQPALPPSPVPMPPVPQQGYPREGYPQDPYAQPNPYVAQAALPPSPQEIVPTVPTVPTVPHEPLSRTQLAQWQRGLESWERRLDRRDNEP